jgi:hypothetical protein
MKTRVVGEMTVLEMVFITTDILRHCILIGIYINLQYFDTFAWFLWDCFRELFSKHQGTTKRPRVAGPRLAFDQSISRTVVLYRAIEKSRTHIKIFIDGCNSIQFDWINKHTTSLWLYKSPLRSRHAVTYSRQSLSCLSTVEVQGCLFHKCNECSLSNTTWHLVLTWLATVSLGIHFPILLCQTNRQYLVCEPFPWHRNSSPGCIRQEESERMHRWTRWTFPTLNITLFFCFLISM